MLSFERQKHAADARPRRSRCMLQLKSYCGTLLIYVSLNHERMPVERCHSSGRSMPPMLARDILAACSSLNHAAAVC